MVSCARQLLTCEETLAARLAGCHGSVGHSELAAAACTEARQGIQNWARGSAGIRNWGRRHCLVPCHTCDFVARQSRATLTRNKVAACDYEVARCDFVAQPSRASKSRDKIAGVTWYLGFAVLLIFVRKIKVHFGFT